MYILTQVPVTDDDRENHSSTVPCYHHSYDDRCYYETLLPSCELTLSLPAMALPSEQRQGEGLSASEVLGSMFLWSFCSCRF